MTDNERIRVRFSREGGVAGVRQAADVDTASLNAEQATTLRRLIADADILRIPEPGAPRRGADRFRYRLSVDVGERHRELQVSDGAVPEAVQPLIEFLATLAKPSPATAQ